MILIGFIAFARLAFWRTTWIWIRQTVFPIGCLHVLSLFPDSYDSFLGCNQKKSLSALTRDFHSYSYPPLLLYHIRLHHLDQTQVHRLFEEFFCLAIMIGTPSTVHKQNYEMRLRPGEISTVDTRQDNTYRLIRRVIWIIDFDTDTVFV